ncbi:uncharacterized protein MKK02DRAFT_31962 [Dioszegia hungarica]|uniref:Uncharacterized protein n=1 Tax=Dioszegia hungarica TaxID=4972 RepID=A0AA38HBZ9_9TREE|nr:uncharacterized protein MKK02DRAFT_31962 [Dioszegia hungarica]KAI9638537.1 hypothetical protein MKK02DRAFT_31962 [Dioszegia hungarica]
MLDYTPNPLFAYSDEIGRKIRASSTWGYMFWSTGVAEQDEVLMGAIKNFSDHGIKIITDDPCYTGHTGPIAFVYPDSHHVDPSCPVTSSMTYSELHLRVQLQDALYPVFSKAKRALPVELPGTENDIRSLVLGDIQLSIACGATLVSTSSHLLDTARHILEVLRMNASAATDHGNAPRRNPLRRAKRVHVAAAAKDLAPVQPKVMRARGKRSRGGGYRERSVARSDSDESKRAASSRGGSPPGDGNRVLEPEEDLEMEDLVLAEMRWELAALGPLIVAGAEAEEVDGMPDRDVPDVVMGEREEVEVEEEEWEDDWEDVDEGAELLVGHQADVAGPGPAEHVAEAGDVEMYDDFDGPTADAVLQDEYDIDPLPLYERGGWAPEVAAESQGGANDGVIPDAIVDARGGDGLEEAEVPVDDAPGANAEIPGVEHVEAPVEGQFEDADEGQFDDADEDRPENLTDAARDSCQ